EAMDLTENERAELAVLLIDSLGAPDRWASFSDEEVLTEIRRRADELESGEVKGIPWEQVKASLEAKIR
ncbi:MAG: addiction module protein, partial [Myxococcota bacterium]